MQIVEVLRPQKAVAFREDFEDSFTVQRFFGIEQCLLDTEDQFLLAQTRRAGHLKRLSQRQQFRNGFPLELGDVHDAGSGVKQEVQRAWQDSNLRPSAPEADALSN